MSLSLFNLTGRDIFKRPYKGTGTNGTPTSLDANFLNVAQDAVVAIETLLQNAVTVEIGSSRSTGLSTVVQTWTYVYTNVTPLFGGSAVIPNFLLNLSPVVLEDAGIIQTQTGIPSQASVSLASALGVTFPSYKGLSADASGTTNMGASQPYWTKVIQAVPFLKFSIRAAAATGEQVFSYGQPVFFDAGSGLSPRVSLPVFLSLPSQYGTNLPFLTYEVSLILMNWIP